MKQNSHAPGLYLSLWLYRSLLKLHTPQFRAGWSDQMLLMHEEAYLDAWHKKGFCGVLGLWSIQFADTLPEIYGECEELYQILVSESITMREFFGILAPVSSALLMVFAGAIAVIFWLVLGTKGTYQSGGEWSTWFIILFDGAIAGVGLLCLIFWKTIAAIIR